MQTMSGAAWKKNSEAVRKKLKMTPSDRPWTARPITMLGVPSHERHLDLLDIGYRASIPEGTSGRAFTNLYDTMGCDVSQGLSFRPWFTLSLPCFTTSSSLYLYKEDRLMLELEKFRILGFPPICRGSLSNSQLKDLSGECMAVHTIGVVLYSMFVTFKYEGLFAR